MRTNNLSKVFKYVNERNESVTFTYENGYVINKPIGIDTLAVDYSRSQGINQVGQSVQGQKIQSRPINISGVLIDNYYKDLLLSVIRPDLKGKLYADDYFLDVVPTMTPQIAPDNDLAEFSLVLLAPYPYWQKSQQNKTALTGLKPLFKFPINFTKPYKFAEKIVTKFITITNVGQLPVPFKVTIYANGTCVNPTITNVGNRKFLKLNKTMRQGEQIIIDIRHDRTNVISSVDGDIRGALTLDSTLDRLEVGDNVLKPVAENAETVIDYAIEKVGVSV